MITITGAYLRTGGMLALAFAFLACTTGANAQPGKRAGDDTSKLETELQRLKAEINKVEGAIKKARESKKSAAPDKKAMPGLRGFGKGGFDRAKMKEHFEKMRAEFKKKGFGKSDFGKGKGPGFGKRGGERSFSKGKGPGFSKGKGPGFSKRGGERSFSKGKGPGFGMRGGYGMHRGHRRGPATRQQHHREHRRGPATNKEHHRGPARGGVQGSSETEKRLDRLSKDVEELKNLMRRRR